MERETLLAMWDEFWSEGLWFGSWSEAVQDLTPEQASYKPQAHVHSIWQLVNHVVFWRGETLKILAGEERATPLQLERMNFAESDRLTHETWSEARAHLKDSHDRIRAAIADPSKPLDRMRYHLTHDSNHLGQILYIRRLLGLPPVSH